VEFLARRSLHPACRREIEAHVLRPTRFIVSEDKYNLIGCQENRVALPASQELDSGIGLTSVFLKRERQVS
jgi:hypothetical protein